MEGTQDSLVDINNKHIYIQFTQRFANRPTIIFLHDSLGCIQLWRDFPQKLGERTNCNTLVYDRLGYGKSNPFMNAERNNDYLEREADILAEIITKYSIENAILFGHSDGGSIALIAAAKYPLKISAIITEGAHIFVEDVTLQGIRAAIDIYRTTDLKVKLEKYHGNKTDAMFWAWAKTWTSEPFQKWNIEHFLPLIKCPVYVIQGSDDEYGTLRQVEGIINQVSVVATKLILPGVKHSPHKEVPEVILEKASQFISELHL
jgi:pimeloyl-ACP methyl ester carboxylesterase